MLPSLRPGQVVLFTRHHRPQVGDVVMISHDGLEKIKRVARLKPGVVFVLGDNPAASTDSRDFGWLGEESVLGVLAWPRPTKEL